MTRSARSTKLADWFDRESLGPDLGRAFRSAVALLIPLLFSLRWQLPFGLEAAMVGIGAWTMAGVDVHGPYPVRLTFLLVMSAVMTGATALGSILAPHGMLWPVGAALIAVNAGLWRHLTTEYGPSLAVPTGLVFLIALNLPENHPHAASVAAGAVLAIALQVFMWPIHPQHPLRRSVAGVWLEVGKLFDAFSTERNKRGDNRNRLAAIEGRIRKSLDDARAALLAVRYSRSLIGTLETLRTIAGRIATRGSAAEIIITSPNGRLDSDAFRAAFSSLSESIAALSRTIALTIVSREPAHLTVAKARIQRVRASIQSLSQACHTSANGIGAAGLADVANLLAAELDRLTPVLESVTARGEERSVFPTEFFDLRTWRLQPLAAALNLRARVDPILWRFTARLGTLLILGVIAMNWVQTKNIPHAYWLPYTMLVVSQPDYGATRRRAVERAGGTLAGVLFAALIIRVNHAPLFKVMIIAVCGFIYGYHKRLRYGRAVIFLTITVIMLIDARTGATWRDPLERLAGTAAGAAIALLAAFWFWPDWERRRHPPIVAAALRANDAYLQAIVARLHEGGAYDAKEIAVKRAAEAANAAAFASLGRLFSDPSRQRGRLERVAALVNSNQRLTNLFTVLLLHGTSENVPVKSEALDRFAGDASQALQFMAEATRALAEGSGMPMGPGLPLIDGSAEFGSSNLAMDIANANAELNTMLNGLPKSAASITDDLSAS